MRFPEFSGEWEQHSLSDYLRFKNGLNPDAKRFGKGIKFISVMDILNNASISYDCVRASVAATEQEISDFEVEYGDVLFQRSSETLEDIGRSNIYVDSRHCVFGGFVIRGKKIGEYEPYFMKYRLDSPYARKSIIVKGAGAQHFNIGQEGLSKVDLFFPKYEEQVKIGDLLRIIDDRINTQSKIIEELTTLRSALHQGIMSTGLKDGSWRMQTLAEVLSERTELNNEGHAVHSVSVSKGIVNQIEYLGRSFAAKDTSRYHVAYPGDVIYTKSPTGEFPYGIVKQSQISIKAALSPLYGVYVPISPEIGYIIHNHFLSAKNALNYLHPLIQKGAKNTINITNQRFLQNSMPLPTNKNAALLYYNAIKTVSDKIILEEMVMEKFQSQKSFLLKTMFI